MNTKTYSHLDLTGTYRYVLSAVNYLREMGYTYAADFEDDGFTVWAYRLNDVWAFIKAHPHTTKIRSFELLYPAEYLD